MAVIPRYRRLGVQAAAPQKMDFANFREQAQLGQTISSNVDRMSQFVLRDAQEKAAQAGREAVRDIGAQPVLQRLSEAGGPNTIAEREAYNVANRIASAEIRTEADNEIQRILSEAETNLTPIGQVQQQLSDVVDGFSAALAPLDPEIAGMLQVDLAGSANSSITRYGNFYSRRMAALRAERLAADAASMSDNLVASALSDMSIEDLEASVQEQGALLIERGMDEDVVQRWSETTYRAMVRENTLYRASTIGLTDLKAVAEDLPTEPLPGMTFEETLTEHNRMVTIFNTRMSAAQTDLRVLGNEISDVYSVLNAGGMPSAETMADMFSRAEGLQELFPDAMTDFNNLQGNVDFAAAHRGMSVPELENAYARLQGGITGVGDPGLDTKLEVYRRDMVGNLLSSAQSAARLEASEALAQDQETAAPLLDTIRDAQSVISTELSRPNPRPGVLETALRDLEGANAALPESQRLAEGSELVSNARALLETVERVSGADGSAALLEMLAQTQGEEIPADLPAGMTASEFLALRQQRESIIGSAAQRAIQEEAAAESAELQEDRETAAPLIRTVEKAANALMTELSMAQPNFITVTTLVTEIEVAADQIPESQMTDELLEALNEIRVFREDLTDWREALPSMQQEMLEDLREQAMPGDLPEGVDLVDQIELNQRRASMLESMMQAEAQAIGNGQALAYAAQNGFIVPGPGNTTREVGAPIDISLAISDPQAFMDQIQTRFEDVGYVEDRYETAGQNVLLPREKATMEAILANGEPGEIGLLLASMERIGWDKSLRILTELDTGDKGIGSIVQIGSLMAQGQSQAAMLALKGMEQPRPTVLTPSQATVAWNLAVPGHVFQELPQHLQALQETSQLIYTGMSASDSNLTTILHQRSFNTAISLALGNGRIEDINGEAVYIGVDDISVEPDNVSSYLENPFEAEHILVGNYQTSNETWKILETGDWYPVAVGDGIYQLRSGKGYNAEVWGDITGRPILVDLFRMHTAGANRAYYVTEPQP